MKSKLQVTVMIPRMIPGMIMGIILGVLATLAGCGTATTPVSSPYFAPGVSPALVMTTPMDTATWEYRRNDELLNVGQQPIVGSGWAEIRTFDRRRTANGRPRESSATYVRTLSRHGHN